MQTVVRVKDPGVSRGALCCEAYVQEVDQVPYRGDKEGKPLGFQQREGKRNHCGAPSSTRPVLGRNSSPRA